MNALPLLTAPIMYSLIGCMTFWGSGVPCDCRHLSKVFNMFKNICQGTTVLIVTNLTTNFYSVMYVFMFAFVFILSAISQSTKKALYDPSNCTSTVQLSNY